MRLTTVSIGWKRYFLLTFSRMPFERPHRGCWRANYTGALEQSFTPHQRTITDLALRHRLPSMFIFPLYVDAGGLMSYSYDILAIYRRLGY